MAISKITLVANTVSGDEKALGLLEMNEQSPTFGGFHRYQIIHVLRDGKVAEFRTDMGLASQFKNAHQLNIPSYLEHSVDELKDLADELRYVHTFDYKDYLQLDKVNVA